MHSVKIILFFVLLAQFYITAIWKDSVKPEWMRHPWGLAGRSPLRPKLGCLALCSQVLSSDPWTQAFKINIIGLTIFGNPNLLIHSTVSFPCFQMQTQVCNKELWLFNSWSIDSTYILLSSHDLNFHQHQRDLHSDRRPCFVLLCRPVVVSRITAVWELYGFCKGLLSLSWSCIPWHYRLHCHRACRRQIAIKNIRFQHIGQVERAYVHVWTNFNGI